MRDSLSGWAKQKAQERNRRHGQRIISRKAAEVRGQVGQAMDRMARFHYFQEPDGLVPGIPAGNSSLDDRIGAIRLGVGARDPALADSRAAGAICSVSSFSAIWARTAFARARLAAFFAFLDARRASLNSNFARQVLSLAALAFFSAAFTCSRAMRT